MFKKIGLKIIFAVGIAIIIIITFFAYSNIQYQSDILLAEMKRHSHQLSETIKSSVKYDMMLNRREHILKIIRTIGSQEFMKEVRIFDKAGTIIYSSDTSAIDMMVDKKAEACYGCHAANEPIEKLAISERARIYKIQDNSERVLGMINAIYNEPSCWEADCHAHDPQQSVLGVLDITVSLQAIDELEKLSTVKMIIFALFAIIAISATLWYFVKVVVDKPVNELLNGMEHIANGNLNYRINVHGKDELGRLARSFNNMTQKLSEARMQLFQSDKMASLGRLAAGVAHEINNPLTGILTYSSFLLKRSKSNPEMEEDLSIIVRETKRSREIVKSLLDFARQSIPKKNVVEINEIIQRALKVIDNQLSIKDVKLQQNLGSNLPPVVIDANQIQQVIINLIVNAVDAIKEQGGSITISTKLISLAPFGIIHIKKAFCPKGHDLMDKAVRIDGMPSVKLRAKLNGNEGYINIDPIYGKRRSIYGIKLQKDREIALSCPTCNISLVDKKKKCEKCGAPAYFFLIPEMGILYGCTRKECYWQYWEFIEQQGNKEHIEVKISDTGCGIPEEDLEKIFEPFFTTKGQKGTGLGLAVIWGIIDNHNGSISVESEVGKGTTFTFRIPAVKR